MTDHPVATEDEWLAARKQIAGKEKEIHPRARRAERRSGAPRPGSGSSEDYRFDDAGGPRRARRISSERARNSSSITSCSRPIGKSPGGAARSGPTATTASTAHLAHRDTRLVAISRAPREKLVARGAKVWAGHFPGTVHPPTISATTSASGFRPGDLPRRRRLMTITAPASMKMTDLPGFSAFITERDGAVLSHLFLLRPRT